MSDFNTLEEQAKKRRTYNPNPSCPVIEKTKDREDKYTTKEWTKIDPEPYYDFNKKRMELLRKCDHKKKIKKYLFTSSYEVCEDCGVEL